MFRKIRYYCTKTKINPETQSEYERSYLRCGSEILLYWINLDSVANQGIDVVFNLNELSKTPLPFKVNEISLFLLSHLLGHLERPLDLMQELWRVVAPGAKIIIQGPHCGND